MIAWVKWSNFKCVDGETKEGADSATQSSANHETYGVYFCGENKYMMGKTRAVKIV